MVSSIMQTGEGKNYKEEGESIHFHAAVALECLWLSFEQRLVPYGNSENRGTIGPTSVAASCLS